MTREEALQHLDEYIKKVPYFLSDQNLPEANQIPEVIYVPILHIKGYTMYMFVTNAWDDDWEENERVCKFEIIRNSDNEFIFVDDDYFEVEYEMSKLLNS